MRFTQPWVDKKAKPGPGVGQLWERVADHEPRVIYLYGLERYEATGNIRWMWIKVDGVGKDLGGMSTIALTDMYRRIA